MPSAPIHYPSAGSSTAPRLIPATFTMWGHYDLQVSKVDPPVVTCKLYYNDAGDADHLQSIEATFDDPGSYT